MGLGSALAACTQHPPRTQNDLLPTLRAPKAGAAAGPSPSPLLAGNGAAGGGVHLLRLGLLLGGGCLLGGCCLLCGLGGLRACIHQQRAGGKGQGQGCEGGGRQLAGGGKGWGWGQGEGADVACVGASQQPASGPRGREGAGMSEEGGSMEVRCHKSPAFLDRGRPQGATPCPARCDRCRAPHRQHRAAQGCGVASRRSAPVPLPPSRCSFFRACPTKQQRGHSGGGEAGEGATRTRTAMGSASLPLPAAQGGRPHLGLDLLLGLGGRLLRLRLLGRHRHGLDLVGHCAGGG